MISALTSRRSLAFLVCAVLAGGPVVADVEYCLLCHGDEGLTLLLDDGDELGLFVDEEAYRASVHGADLLCTDCHAGYEDDGLHPAGNTFENRRAYVLASYDLCKECHFDTYTRTLESVHYELIKAGDPRAPVCADCHGAHDIPDPHVKSAMVSRGCATCHREVFEIYRQSVHGAALVAEGGLHHQDVPGCADCHTAHVIADPGTVSFHLTSPDRCVGCHGDEELSKEYDLLPTVASTYLTDFHGVTASFESHEEAPRQVVVVCADCHGYHDVASPGALGEEVMKEKVAAVCASCHRDAAPDFPAAWLSHFPLSFERAPLVYLVTIFYRVLIPFITLGLFLQVCLHLYRVGLRR